MIQTISSPVARGAQFVAQYAGELLLCWHVGSAPHVLRVECVGLSTLVPLADNARLVP
jgi:hypothetical protein